MAKKNAAGVTVRSEWIGRNGFDSLFKGVSATSSGNAVITASDHNLEDYSFVEVEFYPPSLNGHWIRLFIPRAEVEAIVILEKNKDASLMGFKERKRF
jgi:hypothetical protein